MSSDGLTNTTRLVRANADAPFETGFEPRATISATGLADGGTRNISLGRDTRAERGMDVYSYEYATRADGVRRQTDVWGNRSPVRPNDRR